MRDLKFEEVNMITGADGEGGNSGGGLAGHPCTPGTGTLTGGIISGIISGAVGGAIGGPAGALGGAIMGAVLGAAGGSVSDANSIKECMKKQEQAQN